MNYDFFKCGLVKCVTNLCRQVFRLADWSSVCSFKNVQSHTVTAAPPLLSRVPESGVLMSSSCLTGVADLRLQGGGMGGGE